MFRAFGGCLLRAGASAQKGWKRLKESAYDDYLDKALALYSALRCAPHLGGHPIGHVRQLHEAAKLVEKKSEPVFGKFKSDPDGKVMAEEILKLTSAPRTAEEGDSVLEMGDLKTSEDLKGKREKLRKNEKPNFRMDVHDSGSLVGDGFCGLYIGN
ncbi:hypothetical protein HK097_008087 [Rhizophlyctis rosea]|uniref:Uncharacterized protein n=1 Tax=Rhizophlyctis rosea TaxID=64517 RepID=A0AAD5X1W3_9FUNG|nr:hypothetical protein HK097_008087 [Rhizophlyctis rosea]